MSESSLTGQARFTKDWAEGGPEIRGKFPETDISLPKIPKKISGLEVNCFVLIDLLGIFR